MGIPKIQARAEAPYDGEQDGLQGTPSFPSWQVQAAPQPKLRRVLRVPRGMVPLIDSFRQPHSHAQ